jgi:hypothetical protein
MVAGLPAYTGSTRNGVTSNAWEDYPSAYTIARAGAVPPAVKDADPDPGTLAELVNPVGRTYYFRVTGSTAGGVWGTDVYTADSSLAAAAVHAGALRDGETGVVRVQVVAALAAYAGSARNGITSNNWDAYPVAYTIARASATPPPR